MAARSSRRGTPRYHQIKSGVGWLRVGCLAAMMGKNLAAGMTEKLTKVFPLFSTVYDGSDSVSRSAFFAMMELRGKVA